MKNSVCILALLFSLSVGTNKAQQVGDDAPDFTLNVLGGGSFTLSEQVDKVVMIFVFGYTCHFCISSAPIVEEKLITPYEGYEAFVPIGIDIWDGSVTGVEAFQEDTGLEIPLLMMGGSFADDYNTIQDRIIVIDQAGKIAYKNNGGASSVTHQVIPVLEEKLGIITALEQTENDLQGIRISPNPVQDMANLRFDLNKNEQVQVLVQSIDGRVIRQLNRELYPAGEHSILLDLSSLTPGLYLAHVSTTAENHVIQLIKN